jgi:hypothetical protein
VKHTVKVTVEQEARLQQAAAAQSITVARLMVESALAGNGWTPTQRRALVRELLGLRRTIAGIGTNLNQLARWANASERFPRQAEDLIPDVRAGMSAVTAVAEELRRA